MVLILFIVVATVFAVVGVYRLVMVRPEGTARADWSNGVLALAWAALTVALAFWHGGK